MDVLKGWISQICQYSFSIKFWWNETVYITSYKRKLLDLFKIIQKHIKYPIQTKLYLKKEE